ncbi:MAG TPA: PQQ-binding-like beta-propeller repeat protein [Pirellulales bacterium]|nr:PQQ-binding-like beta-propeller repeat protein [Pirellulales bacterium]
MNQRIPLLIAASFVLVAAWQLLGPVAGALAAERDAHLLAVKATDWPWWRGRTRDGVADAGQKPPLRWSDTENIVWKAAVPGRGHSSPTIVGDRIFLATADKARETRSVLCYDRETGRELWNLDVHTGGFEQRGHAKSSQASATIACDGERVFANFLDNGNMVTTAVGLDGDKLWQTRVCEFATHQGFGSSPAVYESLVIVSADSKAGGVVAALDRRDGTIVWSYDRPKQPNYTSPAILRVNGRDQLLLAGCDRMTSLDPASGEKLWEIEGSTTECVGSVVSDGKLVFASGGYPKKLTLAVLADGSGKMVWQNDVQTYVPSMLVSKGHLYTVTDGGIAMCWEAATGNEAWKSRLGGTFNASLVLVGDQVFATNQEGRTFIFKASPAKFQLIAENQLGDDVYATPVVCGDRIYLRVARRDGEKRQEWLYAIGDSVGN